MNLSTFNTRTLLATFAFALASAAPGFSSPITFPAPTITVGGTASANSGETTSVTGATVTTFDSGTVPSNYSLTGSAGIVQGNKNGVYAEPAGDSTRYLTTGTGKVTMTFTASPIDYFGFYWSTVDNYNTITFTNTLGQELSYTGNVLAALGVAVNGTQSAYVNFFAAAGEEWKSVSLSSTQNAFEVDNVATAAPEPASLAMIGLGLGLAAFGVTRRRKVQAQTV